jgi:hypothetical protein
MDILKGKPVPLGRLVRNAVKVDKKSRAEPGRANQSIYAELRARQTDLTKKLAGSGYL